MRATNLTDYKAYAHLLSSDPDEVAALTRSFSVNVTEFFRDSNFFELFGSLLLPQLVDERLKSNSGPREVRIWCAGCATGEEPYSLAMLCREMQTILPQVSFRIFGTDISSAAIDLATGAKYPPTSLKNVTQTYFAKYFVQDESSGQGSLYEVSQDVRRLVTLEVGDMARVTPPADIDVICCRNVMIYFDSKAKDIMIQKFHGALRPGGYLTIGQSEALIGKLALSLFQPIYPKERTYRKVRI
jgi:chemotaxis methyl-accepting protein methylase